MDAASLSVSADSEYLLVRFIAERNEVHILANKPSLMYLRECLTSLIDSDVDRQHFHFEKNLGDMEGNVHSMVIGLVLSPPA
jgi:hypothetical protein